MRHCGALAVVVWRPRMGNRMARKRTGLGRRAPLARGRGVRPGAVAWTELGELRRVEKRVGSAAGQRADPGWSTADECGGGGSDHEAGQHAAARTMPGVGAAGVGVPLPQVASLQVVGDTSGDSTAWTMVTPTLSLPEATVWGTRPPRTAAATTATRPTRHFTPMPSRLEGVSKGQLRMPESPLRKPELFVAPRLRRQAAPASPRVGPKLPASARRTTRDDEGRHPSSRNAPPARESFADWTPTDDAVRSARPRSRRPPGPRLLPALQSPSSGLPAVVVSCPYPFGAEIEPRRNGRCAWLRRQPDPASFGHSVSHSVDPMPQSAQIPVRKVPEQVRKRWSGVRRPRTWRWAGRPCGPRGPRVEAGRGRRAARSG